MSRPEQIMSVLLDAEDMRLIHRAWPVDMRLGVCLMPSGDCQLMLFHQDESTGFPDRLKDHFGLRASEISIHPKVAGFATHPMKYSEERALANLLSDNLELTEEALDYSVNFSYAREEGLDPVNFMGRETVQVEMNQTAIEDAELAAAHAPELTFSTRRKPAGPHKPLRNLHFDWKREAQRLEASGEAPNKTPLNAPTKGFKSAAQLSAIDKEPKDFALTATPAGGIVIQAKSGVGSKIVVRDAQQVFLRDDRKLLALQLTETSVPEEINILPHAVPSALLTTLGAKAEAAEVFIQDDYVYVTLGQQPVVKASSKKPKPEAKPLKTRKRWAAVRLIGLTAVTIAGIYLVLNSPLGTAPEPAPTEAPIDWQSLSGNL